MIRSPEVFREKQNIDARILQKVVEINLREKKVRVEDIPTGKILWEAFDQLILATGAVPIWPDLPGAKAKGIYGLTNLQTGIELRKALDQEKPQKAVIVGGGYIGLELAESFAGRGLEVTVVEKMSQVMTTLDPDMAGLVLRALEEARVKVFLEESLESLETKEGRVCGVVTNRRRLPADIVVLSLGVRPNSALAKEAGIATGETGAIQVSDRMQTDSDGIWAAGNCAEAFHLVSRRPFFLPLGTVANKQGRVAGINISGGQATFPGVVGTAMVKVFAAEVARTGLLEREIQKLGWSYITAKIEAQTRAGYYPGSGKMTVKVLAEKGTGRLLGGQIVGLEGAGKRIDVIATALHAGFTVEQMINLDLGYSPPFSAAWDPVLIAARQAASLV